MKNSDKKNEKPEAKSVAQSAAWDTDGALNLLVSQPQLLALDGKYYVTDHEHGRVIQDLVLQHLSVFDRLKMAYEHLQWQQGRKFDKGDSDEEFNAMAVLAKSHEVKVKAMEDAHTDAIAQERDQHSASLQDRADAIAEVSAELVEARLKADEDCKDCAHTEKIARAARSAATRRANLAEGDARKRVREHDKASKKEIKIAKNAFDVELDRVKDQYVKHAVQVEAKVSDLEILRDDLQGQLQRARKTVRFQVLALDAQSKALDVIERHSTQG